VVRHAHTRRRASVVHQHSNTPPNRWSLRFFSPISRGHHQKGVPPGTIKKNRSNARSVLLLSKSTGCQIRIFFSLLFPSLLCWSRRNPKHLVASFTHHVIVVKWPRKSRRLRSVPGHHFCRHGQRCPQARSKVREQAEEGTRSLLQVNDHPVRRSDR